MRTTISIQDGLLERAKEVARHRRCTLGAVVEDALRKVLFDRKRDAGETSVRLTTCGGEGLVAGVNLDSNSELVDAMEDR